MAEMNRALFTWYIMRVGPPPKQVSDLTNSPVIKGKRLPMPPPGKKFVIDSSQQKVIIVDE